MNGDDDCIHCGDLIGPNEPSEAIWAMGELGGVERRRHEECAIRSAIGGLNHLRGTCYCCGGTDDPDPPNMTRREAAMAAVAYWRLTHG